MTMLINVKLVLLTFINYSKLNIFLLKRLSVFLLILSLFSLYGCASTSNQESIGEYIDDSVITSKVKAVIFKEPYLKSNEINVETYKGIVQLSGFVTSESTINRVIDLAREVIGVKSIMNDMQIKH